MNELFMTCRGVVYPWQCDHMGHLNVAHYVARFDEATWQMFAAIGIDPDYMQEEGCGVAAIRQNISYRHELKAGDLIAVRTGILEISPKQIRFYHELYNDVSGELAATTIITGVHLDLKTRKACPFPEEIVESAQKMIVAINPVL